MKKLFLTAGVALCTLVASAQFMVVTTYDNDQEDNMDKLTTNMGIGYMVNDMFTIGVAKGSDHAHEGHDHDEDEDTYDLWVRYNIAQVEGAYASLQMPTENSSDNMTIGIGFAFNVWNGLYVEPNYTMPTSEDEDGDREGSFNFGLSYRF
tara:strand:+ start:41 stop:490 length:450 start_codon:yes stop_codon:yes gene_type:complete